MDEKVMEKLSSLDARVEHIAVQVEALSLKVDGLAAKWCPYLPCAGQF